MCSGTAGARELLRWPVLDGLCRESTDKSGDLMAVMGFHTTNEWVNMD